MEASGAGGLRALLDTSGLSKGLIGLLATGCVAAVIFSDIEQYLSLIPGRTFPLVWNVVTSSFLVSPVELVLNGIALLCTLKIVEPAYGAKGLLLFLFVVSLLTGVLTFVTCFITYCVTLQGKIFYKRISGCHGLVGGLLVAVKHVMPDQELVLFGALKFKSKWLPSIFLTIFVPIGFVLDPLRIVPFLVYGTYSAWIYLRFFQLNEETRLRGEPGADFSFASFFPESIQPQVDVVSTIFSKLFRLGSKQPEQGQGALQGQPLPGSDGAEAARRRERGAKALEDRLRKQGMAQDIEEGSMG